MEKPASENASFFGDRSLWMLIFSNLFTVVIAVREGWSLPNLMLVYWFQSVIIGIFNFIRILQLREFSTDDFYINNKPVEATESTKKFTAFFFLIHYGLFHLFYLVFLMMFFDGGVLATDTTITKDIIYVLPAVLIFFGNHLYSYIYNRPKDSAKQNIGTLMFYPYARVLPMHITIILGAIFINKFNGSILILFLGLKTLADVIAHFLERTIRSREK